MSWQSQPSVPRPEIMCANCPRRPDIDKTIGNELMEWLGFGTLEEIDTQCEGPQLFVTTIGTDTCTNNVNVIYDPDCPKMYPDVQAWNSFMMEDLR